MAFIKIVESDEAFEWSPVHEEKGEPYESVFQLRLVTDDVDGALRKKATGRIKDERSRMMVDKLRESEYIAAVLDYAIVGWRGVQSAESGKELPCTTALKARLPERWKAEILRLCAGKEAGDVVAHSDQEKKVSATT